MHATNRKRFLLVTALLETALGLCLLVVPVIPLAILLGLEPAATDTLFVGRVAGAALLAIGVASWIGRADTGSAQLGLLSGILVYNAAVTVLLVFAGTLLKMVGVLLWPTVVLHAVLVIWCVNCLRSAEVMGRR
jgi:hypothetical protein